MSNKYRLIKIYPGSPKLNTIIDDETTTFGVSFSKTNLSSIENYPEFWQEIVEKDYEILSLARLCSIKPKITDVSDYSDGYIEALLKYDKARIHSVKRKDGEIFTIGDKVIGYNNSIAKIKTIDLVGEVSLNIGTDKHEGFSLKNLKKVKQPLFTTEDGVDIFEGDKYSVIDLLENEYRATHNTTITGSKSARYILISTKEKAEKYIIENKPCLSINDIINNILNIPSPRISKAAEKAITESLKQLVKTKIK